MAGWSLVHRVEINEEVVLLIARPAFTPADTRDLNKLPEQYAGNADQLEVHSYTTA